ncbi:MAG: helix-turn-helix domain-containing protein [Gammaproteobacteria bacterium]
MSTRYLKLRDAAVYLGVKERFMRRLVFERRIRFYKIGPYVHFDRKDLDAFARRGQVEPVQGLAEAA